MEGDADVPNLSDDEQGSESDGWDEIETNKEQTTCLFCPLQFRTIAVALDHCRTEHNFDLLELKNRFNMDCYSFIKMVNYIRKNQPEPSEIQSAVTPIWNDDIYLRPITTESWLMYDFEDLGSTPTTPNNMIDGSRNLPNVTVTDLQCMIVNLTSQLHDKTEALERAMEDMEKMKKLTKNLIDGNEVELPKQCVGNIRLENDQGYFGTYSHFGIHHEMLSDCVRTESYKNAILNNSETFSEKEVLDLGCGTGILSMFSAKSGAKTVWAVDQSDIIYRAMDIVRENGLETKINAVRGRLEDGQMPFEKVDILVSEWMGYFLLFEGMLDSVVYARDKYLRENGQILPNRCAMFVCASGDTQNHQNAINFWKDVYGFTMKCMVDDVVKEASVEKVNPESILTSSAELTNIDIRTCTTDAVDFSSDFELDVTKEGKIVSFVGYFDTYFELPNPVEFSTGPHAETTHWKQTVFYLKEPIEVKQGDKVKGKLSCRRHMKNARGLHVTISLENGPTMKYSLD